MKLKLTGAALILGAVLTAAAAAQHKAVQPAGEVRVSAAAPPAIDKDHDLAVESRYITQCSCTEANESVRAQNISPAAPAYGVFNDWRIGNGQADFVRPGEAAIGAMGLLVGVHQLQTDSRMDADLKARAQTSLSGFFTHWVPSTANQIDESDAAHARTGFPAQIAYNAQYAVVSKDKQANVGVTAEMLAAMWKYAQLSPAQDSLTFRKSQYALAHRMADYVGSKIGPDHLAHDNYGNAYVSDTSYAVAAFHAFAHWAQDQSDQPTSAYFEAQANAISAALATLQDPGPWSNYKRYKDSANSLPTYGPAGHETVDQTGFAPYEFDARPPGEEYAQALATWWETGSSWHHTLTQQSGTYAGGVHQQDYKSDTEFAANPNGRYLYPGSALQLAAAEWKIARATHNAHNLDARALAHYKFARSHGFWNEDSHLDSFAGGFNDWVDPQTNTQQPETFKRFVDTSAYFIFATEMIEFSQDVPFGG